VSCQPKVNPAAFHNGRGSMPLGHYPLGTFARDTTPEADQHRTGRSNLCCLKFFANVKINQSTLDHCYQITCVIGHDESYGAITPGVPVLKLSKPTPMIPVSGVEGHIGPSQICQFAHIRRMLLPCQPTASQLEPW